MDENLGMEERVIVVDKYYQKLTDSGYLKEQVKKVIVVGVWILVGFRLLFNIEK